MAKNIGKFVKLFAKNLKSAKEPAHYTANDIPVTCLHCGNDTFEHGEAQLNTALLTFFNLDFANRSANILICTQCGYIHWFYAKIARLD